MKLFPDTRMTESSTIYSSVFLDGFLWIFKVLRAQAEIPEEKGTKT